MGRKSKKNDIMQVSEALFIKYGIARIKIREICDKVGISKVTFYKHFKNKNDLVKYHLDKRFEKDILNMRETEKNSTTFRDEINSLIRYETEEKGIDFYTENMDYLKNNPDMKEHMDYLYKRRMAEGEKWIKRCQEQGKISKSIKPEFIMAIFEKLYEVMEDKELLSNYKNASELMNDVDHFFFYGIVGERN